MVTKERIAEQIKKFEANAKKQESMYQYDGIKSHLSTAKKYEEQAEVYRIALKALTQPATKSYTI